MRYTWHIHGLHYEYWHLTVLYLKSMALNLDRQNRAGKYEQFPAEVTDVACRFYQHSLNVAPGVILKTLSQWFLSCFQLVCNEQPTEGLPTISLMRKHMVKEAQGESSQLKGRYSHHDYMNTRQHSPSVILFSKNKKK